MLILGRCLIQLRLGFLPHLRQLLFEPFPLFYGLAVHLLQLGCEPINLLFPLLPKGLAKGLHTFEAVFSGVFLLPNLEAVALPSGFRSLF